MVYRTLSVGQPVVVEWVDKPEGFPDDLCGITTHGHYSVNEARVFHFDGVKKRLAFMDDTRVEHDEEIDDCVPLYRLHGTSAKSATKNLGERIDALMQQIQKGGVDAGILARQCFALKNLAAEMARVGWTEDNYFHLADYAERKIWERRPQSGFFVVSYDVAGHNPKLPIDSRDLRLDEFMVENVFPTAMVLRGMDAEIENVQAFEVPNFGVEQLMDSEITKYRLNIQLEPKN